MAGLSPVAALARVTLTLALSRKGRGDPLAAFGAWFRLAVLVGFWIPAKAGIQTVSPHEIRYK